jgi:integrase
MDGLITLAREPKRRAPARSPINLTVKNVETAGPLMGRDGQKRRNEITDALVPGLRLVVQPSGAKSWAVRYHRAGRVTKMTLGPYAPPVTGAPELAPVLNGPLSLAGARVLAREAMAAVAAGGDPASVKRATARFRRHPEARERDSFEAVARRFIERYAAPKNRAWADQARLLGFRRADPKKPWSPANLKASGGAHPLAVWGTRRIQGITKRDVNHLLDDIMDARPRTAANATLASLRRLFNWAVEKSLIDINPASGIKKPVAVESRDRVLTDDELRRVLQAAEAMPYPFGPFFLLCALTGQRRDEVAGMRWSEMDPADELWTIPRGRMKRDRVQDVPLSTAARAVIATLPRIVGQDLVFSTTGRTPVSGFSRAKILLEKRIVEATRDAVTSTAWGRVGAELCAPWRLHDLRRTLASGMARLGIALPVIEKVLAHESRSFGGIVGVYQRHSYLNEKAAALEAWGRHCTALMRG